MANTGIPRSIAKSGKRVLSGTLFDVVWKVSVLVVAAVLAGILIVGGGVYGAAVGGILLGSLISDDVRQALSDVYHRRFWRWSP